MHVTVYENAINMSEASIRALELYCGIGGMHYALKLCGLENAEVIAAVDISPLSNAVYRHNFPGVLHMEKGIEGLRYVIMNVYFCHGFMSFQPRTTHSTLV